MSKAKTERKSYKEIGKRNFAIGRLRGVRQHLRVLYEELKDDMTVIDAINLHDSINKVSEVVASLEAHYWHKR